MLGEGGREGERGKLNPHERVPSMDEWMDAGVVARSMVGRRSGLLAGWVV